MRGYCARGGSRSSSFHDPRRYRSPNILAIAQGVDRSAERSVKASSTSSGKRVQISAWQSSVRARRGLDLALLPRKNRRAPIEAAFAAAVGIPEPDAAPSATPETRSGSVQGFSVPRISASSSESLLYDFSCAAPQPNLSHSYGSAIHHQSQRSSICSIFERNFEHVDVTHHFEDSLHSSERRNIVGLYGRIRSADERFCLGALPLLLTEGCSPDSSCLEHVSLFFAFPLLIGGGCDSRKNESGAALPGVIQPDTRPRSCSWTKMAEPLFGPPSPLSSEIWSPRIASPPRRSGTAHVVTTGDRS